MRRLVTFLIWLLLTVPLLAGDGTIVGPGPFRVNLLVYFDYAETDLAGWRELFEKASEFLYDYTEKEFQLGNVTFAVNMPAQKSRADVIILRNSTIAHANTPTLDGDRNLGERDRNVNYGQLLRLREGRPGDQSSGIAVMGHELGHYLFGLYDEYQGKTKTLVVKPGSRQVRKIDNFDFCNRPDHRGIVCVMEDTGGTELCMALQDERFLHNSGYFALPLPQPDSDGLVRALFYENDQQLLNKTNCWTHLHELCKTAYDLTVPIPTTPPVSSVEGHQPVQFVSLAATGKDLAPGTRVLLAIDTSTTAARLAQQVNAAQLLLERSKGAEVAVYAPGRVFGPTLVSDATVAALKAQLAALTPTNGRNLSSVLNLMADDANPSSLALMFVAGPDGGPSPAAALTRLKAAYTGLYVIGLPEVEAAQVNALARPTLGVAFLARTDALIEPRFYQAFSEARGIPVADIRELNLAPGGSQTFTLSAEASDLELQASWQGGDLALTLAGVTGTTVRDGNSLVLSADGFPGGNLTVQAQNRGNDALSANLVISSTGRVQADPNTPRAEIAYPQLLPISAQVEQDGFDVLEAEATARVVRPDGSVRTLTLYDDGQASHGDRRAGDGIYTNLFGAYGGNGSHEATVQVIGTHARAVETDPGTEAPQTQTVVPFEREFSFVFTVSGMPAAVPANSLTITPLSPPKDLAFQAAHQDVPALRFRVQSGAGEPVLITSLPLTLSGGGVSAARLYPDVNGDGEIDPDSLPLAELDLTGGSTFRDPLLLPPNTTLEVVLTLDFSQSAPATAAFPLLLSALAWLAWRRKWPLLLLAALLLAGCAEDESVPGSSSSQSANFVQVQLLPSAASARGAVSENPVAVQGAAVGGARLQKQ